MFFIVLVFAALASSQSSVHADSENPLPITNVRHIGLNDTHLVQLNEEHYAVINPGALSEMLSMVLNRNYIKFQTMTHPLYNSKSKDEMHPKVLEALEATRTELISLADEPSQLSPHDRFIDVEYPLDYSPANIRYSQNYNMVESRVDNYTVMYYRDDLLSLTKEMNSAECNRIFMFERHRVCLTYGVMLTSVHVDYDINMYLSNIGWTEKLITRMATKNPQLRKHKYFTRVLNDAKENRYVVEHVKNILKQVRTILDSLATITNDLLQT